MIGSRRSDEVSIFLGVTGASGSVVALRLAEVLKSLGAYIVSAYTRNALLVADSECISREWFIRKLKSYSNEIYDENSLDAPIASSSNTLDIYVLAPATIKTLAMIINGEALNLIVRAVLNGLRMKRPTIAIVREAPLGVVELGVLYRAAKIGMIIIPAVVGFYSCPQSLKDVVDFIVGKTLDVLGFKHSLYRRWGSHRDTSIRDPCQVLYGSGDS